VIIADKNMTFYRYDDSPDVDFSEITTVAKVHLIEFEMLWATPCGWWIREKQQCFDGGFVPAYKKRWVSNYAKKRYAYPTKDEALESFVARKRRQVKILRFQLAVAESALAQAVK